MSDFAVGEDDDEHDDVRKGEESEETSLWKGEGEGADERERRTRKPPETERFAGLDDRHVWGSASASASGGGDER